jgi:flagellar assembly protein FliH
MSCRVFEADAPNAAEPVPWKQLRTGSGGAAKPATAPPPADPAVSIEVLRREFEQKVRESHTAGVREGEAAGRNRAAAEFQSVVEKFTQTIGELGRMRARLRREAEADTLKLALAIARRVLRRELAVDPEALESLLLGALEKLRGQEISRVRVHPSHTSLVSECLRRGFSGTAIEVIGDATRSPGTAIFETGRGNLDASIESQLQEIERGLADRLRIQS